MTDIFPNLNERGQPRKVEINKGGTSTHLTKEEHFQETFLDQKDYFFRQKPKCRLHDVKYNIDTQEELSHTSSITLKPQKQILLATVHSRLQISLPF
jgi:hypothetical protein